MVERDGDLLSGEHRLGSPGRRCVFAFGFVPSKSTLNLREAMWFQRRLTPGLVEGSLPSYRFTRRDRRLVEDARSVVPGLLRRMASESKRRRRELATDVDGRLPLASVSPLDLLTRDMSLRPVTAWHQTSTGRAGVLTTLTAGSGSPVIDGPVIGVDVLTHELFRFDSWATYDAWGVNGRHMTTSPDLFICGLRGNGKSYLVKVLALREIEWGRRVIVQSDRNGEWGRVAEHVGGQVVSPGGGRYLNPFALPDRPLEGMDELWRQEVVSGRKAAFMSLAEALRDPGKPFPLDTAMQTVVDRVVTSFGVGPMTLESAVDRLTDLEWIDRESPSITGFEHDPDLARLSAAAAARVFAPMVRGGTLSGMFDRESTIRLDPSSPMIVFDTSSPALNDEKLRRVYTAAVSSWIDRLLQGRDGLRRIVVGEEAWWLLSNEKLVDSLQTRQRSAGHWGCATWLIVHGVNDMTKVLGEGSELRGRAEEILNQTQTKILFRQGGTNIDLLKELIPDLSEDEEMLIPELAQGQAIWRIGREHPRLVRGLAGPTLDRLLDTSDLRSAA
ncbi:ATP-binding protein [Bifidobacterium saguini DSM 23967]|uniref:ATP-binding protein n=1 Tax=Bifidobacterium saguini DSM 23967 TaxID=1437607 RepID=A0A087D6X5_9BIFI|nr:ATP-binding protein [Bifidobacterium saguini]KFI91275.1 ATP-binding protein [Bifidobacterium saguini DSM 23967]